MPTGRQLVYSCREPEIAEAGAVRNEAKFAPAGRLRERPGGVCARNPTTPLRRASGRVELGRSVCWEASSAWHSDDIARAHIDKVLSEQVLGWATAAVGGTSVVSTESLGRGGHRASGTFRLRIEGPAARATDLILKVPVPGWIAAAWVVTNARALQLAETHGLAAPRLIATDLDGRASGTVATLETFLSGDADFPPTASVARLREAGAALARVHAFSMEPQDHLPHRPRPCAVDDRAAERRRGLMPTTPLLKQADERRQVARCARGRVGVRAWRRLGRQHAVGGRPLRRADRLEHSRGR